MIVNESSDTFLAGEGLDDRADSNYTVFSQEPEGDWQRQVEVKARPRDRLSWFHPQAQGIIDGSSRRGTAWAFALSSSAGHCC